MEGRWLCLTGLARCVPWAVLMGCGPTVVPPADETGTETAASSSSSSSAVSADSTTSSPGSTSTSTSEADGSSGTAATSSDTGTGDACAQLSCDGTVFDCSDGEDDDGDGLIDLDDPHCLSPCDDTEDEYYPGLPTGGGDCKIDCFFDGNEGQGDDGCYYNTRCDPANPGEEFFCSYQEGSNNCGNPPFPSEQSPECVAFCEPYVLPGCDCFGCCEVPGPRGPLHIMLQFGTEDCSLQTPENCPQCTSQLEFCGNPCGECEHCFGQPEPPANCETLVCDQGQGLTCSGSCDCPDGGYCKLGCCYPPQPG